MNLESLRSQFDRPLLELVYDAATEHRRHHEPGDVQCSKLLSVKTGACPEDCGYCSQSAHHSTGTETEKLMDVDSVVAAAKAARDEGADRFCMGAAWREVRDGEEFDRVLDMVRQVKGLGLETCVTLGMLEGEQAARLRDAGLDYYNHNLDTGRSHYDKVVTTHGFDDRLETIRRVREAGMKVCAGGILGLGEDRNARAELIHELSQLDPAPESIPINTLVAVPGTPMANNEGVDWSEVVRTIAITRLAVPTAVIRLSAGRGELDEAAQALCFFAGAGSIFVGDKLLTTPNPEPGSDAALLEKLGLQPVAPTRERDADMTSSAS